MGVALEEGCSQTVMDWPKFVHCLYTHWSGIIFWAEYVLIGFPNEVHKYIIPFKSRLSSPARLAC